MGIIQKLDTFLINERSGEIRNDKDIVNHKDVSKAIKKGQSKDMKGFFKEFDRNYSSFISEYKGTPVEKEFVNSINKRQGTSYSGFDDIMKRKKELFDKIESSAVSASEKSAMWLGTIKLIGQRTIAGYAIFRIWKALEKYHGAITNPSNAMPRSVMFTRFNKSNGKDAVNLVGKVADKIKPGNVRWAANPIIIVPIAMVLMAFIAISMVWEEWPTLTIKGKTGRELDIKPGNGHGKNGEKKGFFV